MKYIVAFITAFLFSHPALAADASTKPVKVFILAGRSNMEGQAVVDLEGKDYNEGRGTLATLTGPRQFHIRRPIRHTDMRTTDFSSTRISA